MRYWQITTSRLSRAAQKLEMDGLWHPFQSTPFAWYRIWKKKLIQRVNFQTEKEQEKYFPAIEQLEPLPEMATVSGFREELNILENERGVYLEVPLGYVPESMDAIASTLREYGIGVRIDENLLYVTIPIEGLDHASLSSAQYYLTCVRLYFQGASVSGTAAARNAAEIGFAKMMANTDQ